MTGSISISLAALSTYAISRVPRRISAACFETWSVSAIVAASVSAGLWPAARPLRPELGHVVESRVFEHPVGHQWRCHAAVSLDLAPVSRRLRSPFLRAHVSHVAMQAVHN